jgi:hypothetical protein
MDQEVPGALLRASDGPSRDRYLPELRNAPRPPEIRAILDQMLTKKTHKTRKQRPNRARVIRAANAGTMVSIEGE